MVTARNKCRKKITRTGDESGGHCPKTEDRGGMLSTMRQNRVATFATESVYTRKKREFDVEGAAKPWPSQVVMKACH